MDKRWRQEFGGMRGFREEDMVDEDITAEDPPRPDFILKSEYNFQGSITKETTNFEEPILQKG